jgi:hypothetical protein
MSKKFTLVVFQIQDGDYEYFDYRSYYTSDFQKMNDMQRLAHHFKNNLHEVLMKENHETFWIDDTRTSYVYSYKNIGLAEHDLLEKCEILFSKPKLLFKKENNVIQLKRKVG